MDGKLDIVALGEAMVEFNQTQAGQPQYRQGVGGDTSNTLMAAARAASGQLQCAYLSAVGDDHFGQLLLQSWADGAVDTSLVNITPGAPTGIYFVSHSSQGHEFSYRRAGSAAAQMLLSSTQQAALARTRWLHYSGISQAISETARQQCALAAQRVQQAGGKLSFDSNLRLKLWSLQEAKQHMLPAIASCDVFLPSLDDVVLLSGLSDPARILAWSHTVGAKQVVLKMGAQGVLVSDGTSQQRLLPHAVKAVDATGAGDCFAGNLLARLALGDDLFAASRYANAAAALSVQSYGATAGLPSAAQVFDLLEKARPL
jgi:2-dehydro-3-deoxygluconokinase